MSTPDVERLRSIKTFPSLVKYLRDELEWPIDSDDFDELTFDYEPEELGLDAKTAVKIKEIKQLRPLASNQPWGIFFVNFEPKRLPVVVLRRILRSLVLKKRQSANRPQQAAWQLHDLLFISAYGESEHRDITLANFSDDSKDGDLPTLKVLGWDDEDTVLHLAHAHDVLKEKLHWPENPADLDNWRRTWSQAFTLKHREVIGTSKEMAERMAELATAIRKRVNNVLAVESDKGPMRKLMTAFREALIHDLKEDDFADMYAQTVTYGLLSARVSRPAGLVAENVADMVPITNPFLRDLLSQFLTVGGRKGKIDFDELGINDVVQTLRDADMEAVLRDFGDKNRQEDPVIFFYELFLKEYDPKKRLQRGVFYTPRSVVSFIVRSVDELLRTEFGLADGLADTTTWGEMAKRQPEIKIPDGAKPEDPFVQILDPACGTGTFLVEVIDVIHQTMKAKWRSVAAVYDRRLEESRRSQTAATSSISDRRPGLDFEFHDRWNEYVSDHLLPRLYGFELMMAPYAIAHMKIGLKLYETGYTFRSHERARIYLTNSLEPPLDFSDRFEFDAPALAHEAQAVNAVKRHQRFTAVIGNPPYSINSCNLQASAVLLVEPFRYVNGEKIRERGALKFETILQDDYVKFWGLGLQMLKGTPSGIISMISNNGFLTNRVLRGVRKSFLDNFTRLSFIDLHGNRSKGEVCPDGSPDDNVFDINQGVGISILRRTPAQFWDGKVQLADLWGTRNFKYGVLTQTSAPHLGLQDHNPKPPYYTFALVDVGAEQEYRCFAALDEAMPFNKAGFVSGRDDFAVDLEITPLEERIADFLNPKQSDSTVRERYSIKDAGGYDLAKRRQPALAAKVRAKDIIRTVQYRPFDYRSVAYSDAVLTSPQKAVMRQLIARKNLALCLSRGAEITRGWEHIFCTQVIVQHHTVSLKEVNYVFPLYKIAEEGSFALGSGMSPNFGGDFLKALAGRLKLSLDPAIGFPQGLTPEDIFHYIYAVFYSPSYRSRYAEFLKIDFPRLPLTSSLELFRALAKLGGELVALHLMEPPKLEEYVTKYAGKGDSEVAKGYPKFVAAVYDRRNESAAINQQEEPRRSQTAATMTGNVHINPSRWFEGVPENVWNFHIGGYQVCEKWLKDRRGRVLSEEDIAHYQKIVVALKETIRLMAEIDEVIEAHGGWPGAFVTSTEKAQG